MFDRWIPRAPRRSAVLGALTVLTLILAVVGAVGPRSAKAAPACRPNAKLVYACGALWGVHTEVQTDAAATTLESKVGRRFDLIYDYHTVTDRVPSPDEVREVAQGHTLHVTDTPGALSWSQVSAGYADATLRSQALGLKALGKPVFFSFDHEMDARADAWRGTPAQYVAAYRHVHALFAAAGATNVIWVWIVTGYTPHDAVWPSLFPGSAYVDWISADLYAGVNCPSLDTTDAQTESFAEHVRPFYAWAHSRAAAAVGIGAHMPEMLSEYAVAYDSGDPAADASWYAAIPAALRSFPDLHAVALWDNVGGECSYTIDSKPIVLAAFAKAGRTAYVNVVRG